MGDMGLQGAYGATALRAYLMQREQQQIAAQHYADAQQQQGFENRRQVAGDARSEAMNQLNVKLREDALKEAARQHSAAEGDKLISRGNQIAERDPNGTAYTPDSAALPALEAAGVPLTHADPNLASTSYEGVSTLPGAAGGSMPTAAPMKGSLRMVPQAAQPERFIKGSTQKQQADASNQDRKDWQAGIQQQLADIKSSAGPKEPASSYQLQPEIDPTTGQQTGRFLGYNTKANRWEPVQGQGPQATKPAPGAAAAATEKRTTGEALDTLSQLDQAIENARTLVGPGHGQVSNLEQMAGMSDPRIQALGVKMKAAKMRVDHAITGSVRAGASPVLLQQWDNILANKITPEGLKAGVQAMREILGGQAPTDGGPKVERWERGPDGVPRKVQ